jgi:tetratricopeptide (TPR) repeat protein
MPVRRRDSRILRKETLITAIVFFGVGFLGGYIFAAHRSSEAPQASVAAVVPAATQTAQALPPGHPPINADSMIQALEDAAGQNPQDPQAPLRLANLFYDQQRFQEASEWYEKALKLDPRNVDARTDLGTAYFNLGRPRDALREYRQSLEIQPDHQPTLYNMIIVNLEGIHDLAAARSAWQRLDRLNPGYPGLDRLKQQLDAAQGAKAGKP